MRQREVTFAPEARADLLQLYEYISQAADAVTALRYVERVERYCAGFDVVSERGCRRDDIRPGLRVIGFEHRLTIAFAVDDQNVMILRLFYGGQDWERSL